MTEKNGKTFKGGLWESYRKTVSCLSIVGRKALKNLHFLYRQGFGLSCHRPPDFFFAHTKAGGAGVGYVDVGPREMV